MSGYHYFLHLFRFVFFLACLAALGLTTYYTTKLSAPQSLDLRLLDESNSFEKSYLWRQDLLYEDLKASAGNTAFVMWGVEPADTGNHDNPESFTQLVLDKSFDPSSEEAQVFMLNFCEDLFNQSFATVHTESFACPLTKFDSWLKNGSYENAKTNATVECSGATQVPVSRENFHGCFNAWANYTSEQYVISRGDEVTIMYLPFKARVGYKNTIDELAAEFDVIEGWVTHQMKWAPRGVNKGFWIGADFWFLDTYRAMLSTAYNSAVIAMAAAAFVIFLSSRSFSMTLFSVLSMFYVLTSTTATMVALGWSLGYLECICIAILIGISADFVTHFSNAYVAQSGTVSRSERTRHTLVYMGPSVLAAAFTTAASAVIMIFTVVLFFQKFAYVLLFTIVHSTLGAFVFFVTLTECFGPSKPSQLITEIGKSFAKVCCCCCKQKESDTGDEPIKKEIPERDRSSTLDTSYDGGRFILI